MGSVLKNIPTYDTWQNLFSVWKDNSIDRHREWACHLAEMYDPLLVISELKPSGPDPNGSVRKAAEKALNRLTK